MTTVDDPSYRLGLALAEVSRLWRHVLDGRLKPLGLSTARWVALVNLSAHPEGMTQNALALRVGIKGSTLVRQLDLLEADGWVVRRAQPGDRRVKRVLLTPKAHPALASIAAVGSSSNRMAGSSRMARARASRCRWPPLKFVPPSVTSQS